ncbi:MAG: OmpH family outer membrane protein [Bacteroidales bacterium]|nr:OmpH family outer membrane protein [Bacteroidales bacterium]
MNEERNLFEKKQNTNLPLILSGLSLAGVLVLFCICFICGNKQCCTTAAPESVTTPMYASETTSELRIAFVDTDSILQKYALVGDSKKAVERLHASKEKQFNAAQIQLEADYNMYLQTGASMTLQQQQAKEEDLTQRGMKLRQMEEQFMAEINKQLQEKNKITADSVINYINRYNKNHQYTLILEKSGINGVLYGEPALDITQDILNGLNAEYEAAQKK